MESINFEYNFNYLDLILLHREYGIIPAEIISVIENVRTKGRNLKGFPLKEGYRILTGFSNKQRILMVAFNTVGYQINLLQVKIADEDELNTYYCQG